MTILLAHCLAAYMVLVASWLGYLWYQRVQKRVAAGVPDAKVGLYRGFLVEQILTTTVVLGIWQGGVPANRLGLVAPHSWAWSCAAILVIVGGLVWSSVRLRPKAEKLRVKVNDHLAALLPGSCRERSWFGVISVGAGVSEELCFRGFLLYYLAAYLPNTTRWERVLATAIVFGVAHIYQGWKLAIGTGVLGLILASIYLLTGSLFLPMVVHAAIDLRVLLIFQPQPSPMLAENGSV
jgi:uncharacterized protein